MRGFYELPTRDISRVLRALAGIEHITLEDRDAVLVAVEREPQSPGMLLAERLQVSRAPFFLVTTETGAETVYTVYFKFAREVLNTSISQSQQAAEILNDNPDLDYI